MTRTKKFYIRCVTVMRDFTGWKVLFCFVLFVKRHVDTVQWKWRVTITSSSMSMTSWFLWIFHDGNTPRCTEQQCALVLALVLASLYIANCCHRMASRQSVCQPLTAWGCAPTMSYIKCSFLKCIQPKRAWFNCFVFLTLTTMQCVSIFLFPLPF